MTDDPPPLPPELSVPPPRFMPEEVKSSRLAQSHRNTYWSFIFSGSLCVVLSFMPFTDTLALYILPLAYLHWIGLGIIALGTIGYLWPSQLNAARNYLANGEAAMARVVELAKTPTVVMNGQTTSYALVAAVELTHPENGETTLRTLKSADFGADKKDAIDTRFRVGDWIAVVWIPGKFEKTLQVYDFLEIMPGAELVRHGASKPAQLGQIAAATAVIIGFFFALFWNLFAMGRYSPLDFDENLTQAWLPLSIGAVLGVAALALGVWSVRTGEQQRLEKNSAAAAEGAAIDVGRQSGWIGGLFLGVILLAGSALMGGLTVLCWCYTANSLLDASAAKEEPVEIVRMVMVTHNFVFREYKLEYEYRGLKKELLTTPQHLDQLRKGPAVALVKDGWFGWRWVETVAIK